MSEPIQRRPMLPGVLAELQRRGQGGGAVRLVMEWGGTKRQLPKVVTPASAIAQVMGFAAARLLRELIDGADFYDVPSPASLDPSSLKGDILRHEGGVREAARALRCTERYVRKVRNAGVMNAAARRARRRAVDERQLDLVDFAAAGLKTADEPAE